MKREGHLGLSLLIFSPLVIPFGMSTNLLTFIMMGVVFSSLPDLDLKWHGKHRAYTHNVGFGIGFGALLGIPVGYSQGLFMGVLIFSGVFIGVLSHLLGDIIAGLNYDGSPWKLQPFEPFSSKSIGYGFYKATDDKVNERFFKAGVGIFIISILVSQGIVQDLLGTV